MTDGSLLFLMPHLTFGGAERLASQLIRHFVENGRPVTLAVLTEIDGEADAGAEWFEPAGAQIVRLHHPGHADIPDVVRSLGATVAVLVGRSPAYGALPALRERLPHLRLVSFQFNEHELSREHVVYSAFLDVIVAEGMLVASTLIGMGVAEDRIAVIPSGPSLEVLSCVDRDLLPDKLKSVSAADGPIIAFVGRMDPIKRPDHFVSLCYRLQNRAVSFVMAGDGPAAPAVQSQIEHLGLTARIIWLGRMSQQAIVSLLTMATIVVVPSSLDGRPLVVQEAQFCRATVVASRVGSIPDLVEHGVTGLLCPPGDMDCFETEIVRLLDDAQLCRRLAESGHARVCAEGGFAASLQAYSLAILGPLHSQRTPPHELNQGPRPGVDQGGSKPFQRHPANP